LKSQHVAALTHPLRQSRTQYDVVCLTMGLNNKTTDQNKHLKPNAARILIYI
jgi:hypothetical protein